MNREPMRRQALYDLVWSVPVSRLASSFGMSDRGFSKHCGRENIPLPPRGYWAKLAAGRPAARTPLPPLGPNGKEWTWIAVAGSGYGAEGRAWLQREIPGWAGSEPDQDTPPTPPEFEFDLHVIEYTTLQRLGSSRVRATELQSSRHPEVQRLLDPDKARREDWFRGGGVVFKDKTPRRRLAFLNALLLALQRLGGDGKLDDYAREVEVWIGGRRVLCSLLTRVRKSKRGGERQEVLDFQVRARGWYASRLRFEDDRTGPIEESLRQICCGLVVVAELESRDQQWEAYRYRLELVDDELKRAAQNRRERQEAAHRRLVEQACAHREAEDIRLFVAAARRTRGAESLEFARWQGWALEHADSIDPLVAGVDLAIPEAVLPA